MDWQNSLGLSYRKKIRKLQVVFSLKYSLTSLLISGETREPPLCVLAAKSLVRADGAGR